MTEKEWLNCTKPKEMLPLLIGKVSHRKLRLLACASFRQIPEFISSRPNFESLETIEAWADGETSYEAMRQQLDLALIELDPSETLEWDWTVNIFNLTIM